MWLLALLWMLMWTQPSPNEAYSCSGHTAPRCRCPGWRRRCRPWLNPARPSLSESLSACTLIAPLRRIGGSGRPDAASDLPAARTTAAVLQVLRLNFNRGKSTQCSEHCLKTLPHQSRTFVQVPQMLRLAAEAALGGARDLLVCWLHCRGWQDVQRARTRQKSGPAAVAALQLCVKLVLLCLLMLICAGWWHAGGLLQALLVALCCRLWSCSSLS